MSEIPFSDQRPRTTHAEIPEKLKALKPLGKDPAFEQAKDTFLTALAERMKEPR